MRGKYICLNVMACRMAPPSCIYFLKKGNKVLTFFKGISALAKALIKSSMTAFFFHLQKVRNVKFVDNLCDYYFHKVFCLLNGLCFINCRFTIPFNRMITKNTKKYTIIHPKIIRMFFLSGKYSYFFSILFHIVLKKKRLIKFLSYIYRPIINSAVFP